MIGELIAILVITLSAINVVRMALFLIGSDIYNLKVDLQKRRERTAKQLPSFTVIVPAHNEEKTIVACLRSILASRYPQNKVQIIVADDGSTDQTVALAHTFPVVTVSQQPHLGKAGALNYALKQLARGELVMCLDADSTIAPDALHNAARYFTDRRVAAVAANVKIRDDGSLLALIQKFEYIICYQMKRAQTVFNIEYIIGGIGSPFRRSMLEKVGYYDTNTVTEDIDVTMKLIRGGNKATRVIYGADVVTETEPVTSLRGLIRQRFRWKYGRCQTFFKNLRLFFNPSKKYSKTLTWGYLPYAIFGDIAFFLEPLILGYILFIIIKYSDLWTLLAAMGVITLYITFNILGEETIPWPKKIPLLLLTPLMYFLFYTLSFVEYTALLKSLIQLHKIPASLKQTNHTWAHVPRGYRA